MSEPWQETTIGQCLADSFAGEWGAEPKPGNALVFRATDIDDEGRIVGGGALRRLPIGKLTAKQLRDGDVLLEGSGGGPDKPVGRVAYFASDDHSGTAVCSNFFRTLRPARNRVDPRFLVRKLAWFYKQPPMLALQQQTTGIINLKFEEYLASQITVPRSTLEQRKIAQILDTHDTAIHETEAIIAKLKAVKQGLLHDLLTRGIDANGELRPPQAEAPHLYKESPLGWIPKTWDVACLRDAALPSRESFIDGDWIEAPFITSEGIRLIQTGNIGIGEYIDKTASKRFISAASFRMLNCKWVKAGDILICRLADPIGRACIVPEYVGPAITSVDCTIFRVDQEIFSGEFVLAWVNAEASLKRAQDNAAGSTRSRISRSNLGRLPIAKPALYEQQLVASALQASAKRIADEEANLSKLKETRAGLMDDLLTGRVRVTPLLETATA